MILTYWKVGYFPIFPKKVRRFTNRKQSGKFNYPETQEVSGILEKTEHPRGESIQRLSWDGREKKLQKPEQGKLCGIICKHDFSPLLMAVAGLIIFTSSFPWLLLCRKQRQMKFWLRRSKTRERGNPARDLETSMMHKQFSHRTLLAHGLLHKLNFQRWKEASQITLGRTTSPVRVPGMPGKAVSATACKPCGMYGVVFDHTETSCLQDKKKDWSPPAETTDPHTLDLCCKGKMCIRAARWVNVVLGAAPACKSFYLPLG